MKECPHLKTCNQVITEASFELCLGGVDDYDYEECHKWHDGCQEATFSKKQEIHRPREWEKKQLGANSHNE